MKRTRTARLLAVHIGAAAGLLLLLFVWRCPLRLLFGVCCPFCGTTRAWRAAMTLQLGEALTLHPLFWLAPLFLLTAVHEKPLARRLGKPAVMVALVLMTAAFAAVYIARLWLQDPTVWPDPEHSLCGLLIRICQGGMQT